MHLFRATATSAAPPWPSILLAHLAAERGWPAAPGGLHQPEEIGNPSIPARRKLGKGIPFGDHRAVQMTRQDYGAYDLLLWPWM